MPAASLTTAPATASPRRPGGSIPKRRTARGPAQMRTPGSARLHAPGGCSASAGRHPASSGAEHCAHSGPARPRHARAGGPGYPSAERRIGPQALRSDSRHPLNAGGITDYGPATAPSAPPGWVNFQAALPAVPRRHGLPGIGSVARTRRLQRQRRPASCPFRRGTRAHSGPARPLPRAQVVSGYPLLNTESALRLSILTRSTR